MADVIHLDPDTLPKSPAYSQGVSVGPNCRTVYIGGQTGVGRDGAVVSNDVATQAEQALRNVEAVVKDAGGRLDDVIMLTIQVVGKDSVRESFEGFRRVWGRRIAPPAASIAIVAGLASPRFLVEVSGIAVVPEEG
jgi:enamine deaminase RidA (YjgF/YER057c/UK114 family)